MRLPLRSLFPVLIAGLLIAADGNVARGGDSPIIAARKAAMNSRVTKRFDFDERKLGNYETMPMNWRQLVEPGYPRFLEAEIDDARGHNAAPSFHFRLTNGNLGAYYLARDIPVDPDSAYRVIAWIRPRKLKHGAAFLTCGYLGQNLKLMRQTEKRSELVRGESNDEPWTRVEIDLPAGIKNARCLTLSCRVEQSTDNEPDVNPSKVELTYHDVEGEAWFDDISIVRMPGITLGLGDPHGVFPADTKPEFRIQLRDLNCQGLKLRIEVLNADGVHVDARDIEPHAAFCWPVAYEPPPLGPGLYTARLTVNGGEDAVVTRQRRFIVLADWKSKKNRRSANFGVILSDSIIAAPRALERMMDLVGAGIAKINVWRDDMNDQAVVVGRTAHARAVTSLEEKGIDLVGVVAAPPSGLARQYPLGSRSLTEVLASDPAQWRPYFALVLTRFSARMRSWQIGPDTATIPDDLPAFEKSIAQMEAELDTLAAGTPLAIPLSSRLDPSLQPPAGRIFAFIQSANETAMQFVEQLGRINDPAKIRWATIRPIDSSRYERKSRLIDFSAAMIESRSRGISVVFTDAPWSVRIEDDKPIVEPREEFLILRTLGLELAEFTKVEVVDLAHGVHARLFANNDDSNGVLACWTDGSAESASTIRLDLGAPTIQIDLWGNRRRLVRKDDGVEIPVSAMPTLLTPVDPKLVRLSASFALDQPTLAPTVEQHARTLTFKNTTGARIAGKIKISGPTNWRITPREIRLDVLPGDSALIPVRIRLPANQSAGEYELLGRLRDSSETKSMLSLHAPATVDMAGLQVDVLSYREGDHMRVVQRVTNRTANPLNLRASLTSPGMPRQWRSISGLPPGESVVRHFDLAHPDQLSGKSIRVSIEQVGGPLRHNKLVLFE